ncbi:tRNA pseudouridine(13) synthase TruD [Alienimonas chondri]|uniref:tRNA pseudouridine synthase D n=1 Tax=Alienimonas chondri TaxID=2681879 RepID=A0ABX1VG17_9PLAN|nr:tRNA pseudouridine(13) synthase TruD [Alienimonas chondri]NNJ27069.1 tRNA pseudouridine synthase D [Alienimonas chondri]
MIDVTSPRPVPRLHADLPGVGGSVKTEPDDFRVSEVPAYEPCGEGPHLYLRVRKTDVSAEALTAHIARTLGVGKRDIGVAGLKDRRAVTEQWVSVPATAAPRVDEANAAGVEILESRRHTNKLKTGHLRGNRFDVLLRGTVADAAERAAPIAERLRTTGFANAFGTQRFGKGGSTLSLGYALLRGEKTDRDVPRKRRAFLVRLALSAAQSDLFNACLADRISDRSAGTVSPGDVMQVRGSGGLFVVPDLPMKHELAEEQTRVDADETAVTGPIFGPRMKQPTGEPARREAAILADSGLPDDAFRRFAKLTPGTRRPYLVRPADLSIAPADLSAGEDGAGTSGLRVRFFLPAGSYATVLLRELIGDESNPET